MSKRFWSALALGLAAVALVATGCSDSGDGTGNPLTPGSGSDPDFQFVEENVFDNAFEGIDVSLELSMLLIDSIPGAAPARPHFGAAAALDGDFTITSYGYSWENGWHVFTVAGYVAEFGGPDTIDFAGIDSVQLLSDDTPIQVPDSTLNGFNYNAHFDAWNASTTDSLAGDHSVQIHLISMDPFVMEINGQLLESVRFTFSDQSGSCDVNVQSSLTANGIQMDFDSGGCPLQGSVAVSTSYAFDCQGGGDNPWSLAGSGVWTLTGTFNGVNESYTYTNGTNVWTSTEACGGGPAAMSLR